MRRRERWARRGREAARCAPGRFPGGRLPGRTVGRRGRTTGLGAGALVLLGSVALPDRAPAQEKKYLPVIPAGVPVVVLPVQSARPLPEGGWPGGAPSMSETLQRLGAELEFAFGEERGAEGWVMPRQAVARARRNPVVRVDPARLAFQGLVRKPDSRSQIYEPLHGQLRRVAALFGARLVVLPMTVRFEPEERGAREATGGPGGGGEAGRGERAGRRWGRAVLLLALVDVRRSAVLWHGEIEGQPAPSDSPALLATLAARVARQLAPS